MTTASNQPVWHQFQGQLIAKAAKDEGFRQELLKSPKAVLEQELQKHYPDVKVPANLNVKVIEQDANTLHVIVPTREHSDQLSDEQLDAVAGGTLQIPTFGLVMGIKDCGFVAQK